MKNWLHETSPAWRKTVFYALLFGIFLTVLLGRTTGVVAGPVEMVLIPFLAMLFFLGIKNAVLAALVRAK